MGTICLKCTSVGQEGDKKPDTEELTEEGK